MTWPSTLLGDEARSKAAFTVVRDAECREVLGWRRD